MDTSRIVATVIDRRLREETSIDDKKFGFMPARRIMEKHWEMQKELHIVFIDGAPRRGVCGKRGVRKVLQRTGNGLEIWLQGDSEQSEDIQVGSTLAYGSETDAGIGWRRGSIWTAV